MVEEALAGMPPGRPPPPQPALSDESDIPINDGKWKPEYSPDGSDFTPDGVRPGNGQLRPAPLPIRASPRPSRIPGRLLTR